MSISLYTWHLDEFNCITSSHMFFIVSIVPPFNSLFITYSRCITVMHKFNTNISGSSYMKYLSLHILFENFCCLDLTRIDWWITNLSVTYCIQSRPIQISEHGTFFLLHEFPLPRIFSHHMWKVSQGICKKGNIQSLNIHWKWFRISVATINYTNLLFPFVDFHTVILTKWM